MYTETYTTQAYRLKLQYEEIQIKNTYATFISLVNVNPANGLTLIGWDQTPWPVGQRKLYRSKKILWRPPPPCAKLSYDPFIAPLGQFILDIVSSSAD